MANDAVPATAHVTKSKPSIGAKAAAKKTVAKKAKPKAVTADGRPSMKDQLMARKENYTKTKTGEKTTIDNGDEVAQALREMSLEEVYKYAAKTLKVPLAELQAKYQHLNAGQQRMNLGNRLRKVVREAQATE